MLEVSIDGVHGPSKLSRNGKRLSWCWPQLEYWIPTITMVAAGLLGLPINITESLTQWFSLPILYFTTLRCAQNGVCERRAGDRELLYEQYYIPVFPSWIRVANMRSAQHKSYKVLIAKTHLAVIIPPLATAVLIDLLTPKAPCSQLMPLHWTVRDYYDSVLVSKRR